MKKLARLVRKPRLRVVLVTAPAKEAELMASILLEERLIACANLIPGVQSLYWWKGALCKDGETLLLLKAPQKNLEKLLRRLKELHSYDVPEYLVLNVDAGSADYVKWALTEAKPQSGKRKR